MAAWWTLLAVPLQILLGAPAGWMAGGKPGEYRVAVADREAHDGRRSLRLESAAANPDEGYVTQVVKANRYRGKRIRLSAWLKTESAAATGLWLSCNDEQWFVLNADMMDGRQVRGTTPFTRYDLVIDVPEKAMEVRFGARLQGTGKVWIDDFRLDEVERSTPLTGLAGSAANDAPTNLSFEE